MNKATDAMQSMQRISCAARAFAKVVEREREQGAIPLLGAIHFGDPTGILPCEDPRLTLARARLMLEADSPDA